MKTFYTLELETAVTRAVELAARQYARRCTALVLEHMIADGQERELHPAAMRMLELELKTRKEIRADLEREEYHGTIPPYDLPPDDEDPEELDMDEVRAAAERVARGESR